jgi:drug/metabolite transporter (DMT)-like permease
MIYAIPYMLISILSITLSTFFAKMLININYSASLIELYRFLIPLFFTIPFLYKNYVFKLNLGSCISIVLRGFFLFLSQYFLFISMEKISLYEAVILYNMCPFYIYIYDVIKGIEIKIRNIMSLVLGFISIVMILGGSSIFSIGVFYGFLSGIFFAFSQISFHYCSKEKIDRNQCLFLVYLLCSLFSIIHFTYGDNTIRDILIPFDSGIVILVLFILVGFFSLLNQSFRLKAYGFVKYPTQLSIFLYLSVPLSFFLDVVFFNSPITVRSLFGGGLLICSLIVNNSGSIEVIKLAYGKLFRR